MSKASASEIILTVGILIATVILILQLRVLFGGQQKTIEKDIVFQFAKDLENSIDRTIAITGNATFFYKPSLKKYILEINDNKVSIRDKYSGKNASFYIKNIPNNVILAPTKIEDSEDICIMKIVPSLAATTSTLIGSESITIKIGDGKCSSQFLFDSSTTTSTIVSVSTTTSLPPSPGGYNILFVPLFYSPGEFDRFKQEAFVSFDYWLARSPFKDCPNPRLKVNVFFVDPKDCQEACSDVCRDCQNVAMECALRSEYKNNWDKVAGICKGQTCMNTFDDYNGRWEKACGCAGGTPAETSITNYGSFCKTAEGYKVVSHEMGHSFGLCHVSGCDVECLNYIDYTGWDCPNLNDCNEPNKNEFIMDYCQPMEKYGPAAYQYLKTEVFKDYLNGC